VVYCSQKERIAMRGRIKAQGSNRLFRVVINEELEGRIYREIMFRSNSLTRGSNVGRKLEQTRALSITEAPDSSTVLHVFNLT
jgi:hypothetical protein